MSKIKEKLLNNLSEEQMEDIFGISEFEYTELMAKYGEDENYIPTTNEIEDIENLLEDYYKSKEFSEFVEEIDIKAINDSLELKYTDNDILYILDLFDIQHPMRTLVLNRLNMIWNSRKGFE